MAIRAQRDADGTVVLRGDLDLATAAELRRAIELDVDVVDMADVEFLGAAALRVLVDVQRRRETEGRRLRIARPSRVVLRTLDVAGLLDAFVTSIDH